MINTSRTLSSLLLGLLAALSLAGCATSDSGNVFSHSAPRNDGAPGRR